MNHNWKQSLLTLPGVGVSMLPKLVCPACWPAYAALLSSIGLGFLLSTVYLLPVTVVFLTLTLGVMAFRASQRNGFGPFLLGLVAASAVLLGKIVWVSKLSLYAAFGLLVIASFWNAWPRRREVALCSGCEPKEVDEFK